MPDKYPKQWQEKVDMYVNSGWWNLSAVDSACAMFAIPKKDPTEA